MGPGKLNFPGFHFGVAVGDVVTLAGFGRSGFGNYGYTTAASFTNRRIGGNTIESFTMGDGGEAEIFRYTFHHPETAGSLGNDVETIIAPGDSGGPVLVEMGETYGFVGISTFTEGFGGLFGDIGGGVVLEPYYDWIHGMTGVAIPEPRAVVLLAGVWGVVIILIARRSRRM